MNTCAKGGARNVRSTEVEAETGFGVGEVVGVGFKALGGVSAGGRSAALSGGERVGRRHHLDFCTSALGLDGLASSVSDSKVAILRGRVLGGLLEAGLCHHYVLDLLVRVALSVQTQHLGGALAVAAESPKVANVHGHAQ